MPPQPAGVWNSVYNSDKWIDAKGPNRYRRAIYTFVKRTSGYPSSLIFDASDRATSLPRRIPTNTPLQALVTLNDPVYDEAATALAKRVLKESAQTGNGTNAESLLEARIAYEARLVLSRDPSPQELEILRALFKKSTSAQTKPAALKDVSMNGNGDARSRSGRSVGTSNEDFDGLKAVGNVLLNLDAALNR